MKGKRISKGTVIIAATILLIAAGIIFMVYSFMQMRRYQEFILVMAYDMESPEVKNRVDYEGQGVSVTAQNLKSVEYYLTNEVHKPHVFGIEKKDCIAIKFIRGNGAISDVKIYETDGDYLYLEYSSEQGDWNYYIGGGNNFENIKKAVSPEGKQEPNIVLKH